MASPFVKWAGGKRRLLPQLAPHFPTRFDTYLEPFLGGGAVFFHLAPGRAVLGDLNAELISAYMAIRNQTEALVTWLREQPYSEAHFLALRDRDPSMLSLVERAGRMIYLNRTCFNGLYRVNRAGRFNVAFGKYRDPLICDEPNLRAVARDLARADVLQGPYQVVTRHARAGDFVFFDAPYDGTYTGYTADGFDLDAQIALAVEIRRLTEAGVKVVATNSDTGAIREMYSWYTLREVQAPRSISCDAETRKPATELLITNEEAFDVW
jgi:DNA adenine methylase